MTFRYKPSGVCSEEFIFEISADNKIISAEFIGGCNGNLRGIASLIKGMDVTEVINRLQGTRCGYKKTSCPDQIAKALIQYSAS